MKNREGRKKKRKALEYRRDYAWVFILSTKNPGPG